MTKNVDEEIRGFMADKLGLDVSKLTDDIRFIDDLGTDSLDAVELFMKLEDEYSIEITESEAQELQTVKDVIEFVKANR